MPNTDQKQRWGGLMTGLSALSHEVGRGGKSDGHALKSAALAK
jgi:hypothetical protein